MVEPFVLSFRWRNRAASKPGVLRAVAMAMTLGLALASGGAVADSPDDAPAFDRPGIGFAPSTIPAHAFALEQGLPDVAYASHDGTRSTLYSADTLLRAGISDYAEVQIGRAIVNQLAIHVPGEDNRARGAGSTSLALKVALPTSNAQFSWAALATVTVTDGARDFAAAHRAYDLGLSMSRALNDSWSSGLYVNVDRSDGATEVQVSPNINYAITKSLGAFIEAGATHTERGWRDEVFGGGLAYSIGKMIQLDVSTDVGLTSRSPRVIAGIGASTFFK